MIMMESSLFHVTCSPEKVMDGPKLSPSIRWCSNDRGSSLDILQAPSKNTCRLWRPDAMPTFQIFRPKKFPLTLPKISATPQRSWLAWAAALRQSLGHFCISATPTKNATSIEPCLVIRNTGDHEAYGLGGSLWRRCGNFSGIDQKR